MSDKKDEMPNPENYTPKRTFGHHNGTGRKKGSITKSTKITREIIAHALSGQEVNIMDALEKLSSKNPEAYISAIAKLLNYAVPSELQLLQGRVDLESFRDLLRSRPGDAVACGTSA